MERAKLIPAPIDERNVTSDWIYEMFDLGDCVDDNGTYVGFINHVPALCQVTNNEATFSFPKSSFFSFERMDEGFVQLKGRLDRFISETNKSESLFVSYCINDQLCRYGLSFYFKEQQDTNLF